MELGLFALFVLLMSSLGSKADLSKPTQMEAGMVFIRDPAKHILVSQDKWVITIDVNLNNYRILISDYIGALNNVKNINMSTITKNFEGEVQEIKLIIDREIESLSNRAVKTVVQLENVMHTLAPITRTSKRSLLDAGGIALHWLFGVADSRQMESIHTVIGGLTQRSEGLIHLMDRQLSYINSSISTGNKNSRDIQKLADTLSLLNQKITTVQTHFESTLSSLGPAISHLFSVSSAIRMLEQSLLTIKEEFNRFESALEFIALGKINSYFLPPSRLLQILEDITPYLGNDFQLLTNLKLDQMYIYYSVATVHAASIGNKIRLFVNIPIKATNRYFNLYQTKPLPTFINNQSAAMMIKSDYPYFAISDDRQTYIQLSTIDMMACTEGMIKICPPLKSIRKAIVKSCLYALFMGEEETTKKLCEHEIVLNYEPTFYRAYDSEIWLYSVKTEKLIIQCPVNNTSVRSNVTEKVITGTGHIMIPDNCYVHSDHFLLLPHTSETITVTDTVEFHIPPIANIFNSLSEEAATPIMGSPDQIDKIIRSIKATSFPPISVPVREWQKELDSLKGNNWYHVEPQHAFPITIITTLFSVLTILCIWKRACILSLLKRCSKAKEKVEEVKNLKALETFQLLPPSAPLTTQDNVTQKIYPSGIL